MRPSLSVVIPSHNRPDLLRTCLASVRRHAPKGTEILVVDDASPGRAATNAAAAFGSRVVRLERRGGFCAAANAGVRAARGPVVELLNDDTEVTAGWAYAALAHFADPRVAAVAPLVLKNSPQRHKEHKEEKEELNLNPRPVDLFTVDRPNSHSLCSLCLCGEFFIDSAGDRYYLGGVAGKRGHGRPLGAGYRQGGDVFGASASSAFYRRDALLAVGGFPEEFGAYFEDVDVSFRLHWSGRRIVYEPASRVWHRVGASHGRPTRRLLQQQSRNEERVFWRNLPGRDLLRALPWHAAVLAAKAYRRWRAGELLPFLVGRLSVLGDVADVLRHRRRLRQWDRCPNASAWGVESRFWG